MNLNNVLLIALISLLCSQGFGTKICFYSDTHNNVKIHKKIVEQSQKFNPDIVISAGDATDDPIGYVKFLQGESRINKTFIVIGNHDIDDNVPNPPTSGRTNFYNDKTINFGVTYRSVNDVSFIKQFDVNTLMIGIDCFTNDEAGQITWLDNQLRQYKHPNIILVQHSGYSCGVYKAFEDVNKKLHAWVIKNNNRIKMMISGNIHDYARIHYDGIIYVTTGPAGGELRDCSATCAPKPEVCVGLTYNYVIMDTDMCSCTAYDINNKILDHFTYDCQNAPPQPQSSTSTPKPPPVFDSSSAAAPPEPPIPDPDQDPVCTCKGRRAVARHPPTTP